MDQLVRFLKMHRQQILRYGRMVRGAPEKHG